MVGASFDLHSLRSNISSAVDGITDTIKAGIKILTIQGKSLKTLFDDAHVPVPPGFWNS